MIGVIVVIEVIEVIGVFGENGRMGEREKGKREKGEGRGAQHFTFFSVMQLIIAFHICIVTLK